MTEPEIKRCPFCGRHPSYTSSAQRPQHHALSCQCGTVVETAHMQSTSREGVILKWNTRVDLVTVDGMSVRALKELCDTVTAWRATRCPHASAAVAARRAGVPWDLCDGDNHVEDCPVQNALDEVLAAHNVLVPR